MSKQTRSPKIGSSSLVIRRESDSGRFVIVGPKGTSTVTRREQQTGQFVEAAERYASANSASQEIARAKLQELGIIDASGKLTKTYK